VKFEITLQEITQQVLKSTLLLTMQPVVALTNGLPSYAGKSTALTAVWIVEC